MGTAGSVASGRPHRLARAAELARAPGDVPGSNRSPARRSPAPHPAARAPAWPEPAP
jgi:hypothetical protein